MSRSRRHVPISGITTCRSEKDDKRVYNRIFRRVSAESIRNDSEPLQDIRAVSDIWNWGKDGKTWHGHRFDYGCGADWCARWCWECRYPWRVWMK